MKNRRSFLTILGAALIAAPSAVHAAIAKPSVPKIWGDGIHDDTLGLQSLIDGHEVEIMTPAASWVRSSGQRRAVMSAGHFRISRWLELRRCFTITGCTFTHPPGAGGIVWAEDSHHRNVFRGNAVYAQH